MYIYMYIFMYTNLYVSIVVTPPQCAAMPVPPMCQISA